MSHQDNDETSDKVTAETTAAFRADFLGELDDSAAAEAGVRGIEGLPSGSAVLVVKRGPNAGSRFLLDRPVASAGRHPDSDIFLDDVTASRCHAEFRRENGTFRIVDLDSLNGTYVNRQPVDSAVLANGDEIQIGQVPSGVPDQAHDGLTPRAESGSLRRRAGAPAVSGSILQNDGIVRSRSHSIFSGAAPLAGHCQLEQSEGDFRRFASAIHQVACDV